LKSLVYLQEKDLKKLKKYAVKALQLRQLMDEVIILQRQHMVNQMNNGGDSSPVSPANSPDHDRKQTKFKQNKFIISFNFFF